MKNQLERSAEIRTGWTWNIVTLSAVFLLVMSVSSFTASRVQERNDGLVEPLEALMPDIKEPEMVRIPAGSVVTPEAFPAVDEVNGQHVINIEQEFFISKYEISFRQWDKCVEHRGCDYVPDDKRWGRGDRPVISVSWRDIEKYLSWLSRSTGREFRLPTELEWEYAARAGSSERFGPPPLFTDPKLAWASKYVLAPLQPIQTQPVDTGEANPFGLYGVRGNVWEWTSTCFRSDSKSTDESCGIRILRGEHRSVMPNFLREIGTGGCSIQPLPGNFGFRVVSSTPTNVRS